MICGKNWHFCHFWGIFSHFDPLWLANRDFLRVKTARFKFISAFSKFLQSFRKVQWRDQKLWCEKCHFCHFGVFLTPLTPCGSQTRIFPGSRLINLSLYQLNLRFGTVSEKSNEWIKSYVVKTVIFAVFGVFLALLAPCGSQTRIFKGSILLNLSVYQFYLSFQQVSEKSNEWIKSYVMKTVIFCHFWGIFRPFDPLWLPNENFPRVKTTKFKCISVLSKFSASFGKI